MTVTTRTTRPGEQALGLPIGTCVLTLDGALPVEHLCPGDRIVTRAGMRRLRAVTVTVLRDAAMVAVAAEGAGTARPLLLPAAQPVMARDPAGRVAPFAIGALAAGNGLAAVTAGEVRLFALHFEAPAVIYADGVEVVCTPLPVPA